MAGFEATGEVVRCEAEARRRSEPVPIGEIMAAVRAALDLRMMRARRALPEPAANKGIRPCNDNLDQLARRVGSAA